MNPSALKVAELKKECTARGISVTGLRKAGLVEALAAALEEEQKVSPKAAKAAPKKRKRGAAVVVVEEEPEESAKPATKRAKGKGPAKAPAAPAEASASEDECEPEEDVTGNIFAPAQPTGLGTTASALPDDAPEGTIAPGQPASDFFKHTHHSTDRSRPHVRLIVHELPTTKANKAPEVTAEPHRRNHSKYAVVSTIDVKSVESSNIAKHNRVMVRGGNVSDRNWKQPGTRCSSKCVSRTGSNAVADVASTKGVHSAMYAKQLRERERRRRVKELQRSLKEKDADQKRSKREAKEERLKRKMDNEFKSTTLQSLGKNMATKLKNMSKKQLRQIKKTRMAANGALELVSPFQK